MNTYEHLGYELSVLSKCVVFKNLSLASEHVGLSQPQLSRILSRLEEAVGAPLLDRSAPRKTSWTSLAFQVVEKYQRMVRQLNADISSIVHNQQIVRLRIGSLEGVLELSTQLCEVLFQKRTALKTVELDIFDLDQLEEQFIKENLDLIITIREPGKRKYKFSRHVGVQYMAEFKTNNQFLVLSPFELNNTKVKTNLQAPKVFISNSLTVRKLWLDRVGGYGSIPSQVVTKKKKDSTVSNEVLILAHDHVGQDIWKTILNFEFKSV